MGMKKKRCRRPEQCWEGQIIQIYRKGCRTWTARNAGKQQTRHIFQRAGEVYQGLQPVGIDYRNPPFSRERGGDSQTGISEEQEMEEDRGGQRNPGIPPEDNRTV